MDRMPGNYRLRKCDGCNNIFPASELRRCRKCGNVYCTACQEKHHCAAPRKIHVLPNLPFSRHHVSQSHTTAPISHRTPTSSQPCTQSERDDTIESPPVPEQKKTSHQTEYQYHIYGILPTVPEHPYNQELQTSATKKYQAQTTDLRDPNNHQENQLILLDAKIPTDENIWNSPDEEETGETTEEDDNTHYLRCKGCGNLLPVTEFQSCSICGLSYCSVCFEAHDCKSPSIHGHPLAHHTALEESRLALKQIYIINETGRLHYLLPVENPQCRILISTRRLMEIALAPHLITPEERQIILTHRELRIKLRQMHPEIKFY